MDRPVLRDFFIYNPIFDRSEATEHEKLLFFYPTDTPHDKKMNRVGLSEALVKYAQTFSPDKPLNVLHTQKARQVFYNPEPNFWLSLSVELPHGSVSKDGQQTTEYKDEEVQNCVLHSALKQAYDMYKLFNGPMTASLERFNREALVQKLDQFFPQYIANVDFEVLDLLDAFNGIQFLPLDKNTYLKIQSFINMTESMFPQIKQTVFLYNEHLVWSGLEQDDMRVLYRYLTSDLMESEFNTAPTGLNVRERKISTSLNLTGASEKEMREREREKERGARSGSPVPPPCGFRTGPEDLKDPDTAVNAPTLHVMLSGTLTEVNLITYEWDHILVCFLTDAASLVDIRFYTALDSFASRHLDSLDTVISEQKMRRGNAGSAVEPQYKFLYFNKMNLAQKTSFISSTKAVGGGYSTLAVVEPSYLHFISDMHSDFARSSQDGEIIVKNASDTWIVGRKSEEREFYIILNQKNANLIEVNEEVRRMSASHFNNIFFE